MDLNRNQIEKIDINIKPLDIIFDNNENRENNTNIKHAIYNKINNFPNPSDLYMKSSFKGLNNEIQHRIYPLGNEHARKKVNDLLTREDENLDEYMEEDYSDSSSNQTTINISFSNITMIRLCTLTYLRSTIEESTKIYSDNGGSFYKYKIDEQFLENKLLLDKLKRYQISNDLEDSIFNVNCLVHAMIMTNLFDKKIINEMKATCYNRYISRKELDKFGKEFHINFKIIKFRSDKKQWDNITNAKTIIGDKDGIEIKLAIIEKHYILNEIVEGIASYALKNYQDIENICSNKTDEFKLKVIRIKNGRYETNTKQAHINSYE